MESLEMILTALGFLWFAMCMGALGIAMVVAFAVGIIFFPAVGTIFFALTLFERGMWIEGILIILLGTLLTRIYLRKFDALQPRNMMAKAKESLSSS